MLEISIPLNVAVVVWHKVKDPYAIGEGDGYGFYMVFLVGNMPNKHDFGYVHTTYFLEAENARSHCWRFQLSQKTRRIDCFLTRILHF